MTNLNRFWKISVVVVAFTALGAVLAYTALLSYKSTASIAFPLTLQESKVMSEVIGSPQNFDRYALSVEHDRKDGGTSDALVVRMDALRGTVVAGPSNWFEPVLRFSKADLKEFAGDALKLGEGSALIGYRITTKASTPDEAQKKTALLAAYVIDANLRELLIAKIKKTMADREAFIDSTAAEQGAQKYNVSMLEERLGQLKRISVKYPSVNKLEARQVISLGDGGERYMPLPSQMAAVETKVLDIKEKIARSTRGLMQSRAEGEMLEAQRKMTQASLSGRDLMVALLADVQTRLSKSVEGYDKQLFLDYLSQYTSIKVKYLETPRFVVAPEIPVKPFISPLKIIFSFAVLGLLVSLIYQFRAQLWLLVWSTWDEEELHSRGLSSANRTSSLGAAESIKQENGGRGEKYAT
ncbi:hypothetical protein [Rhodoferax sediminis]|uniref:hypothetical protein n=1 Tax=Rhodoferax sediminis TaxID=2509614 RepID=UPI00115CC2E8|nr:hypothetical protein [Rhodoferax sediminis]